MPTAGRRVQATLLLYALSERETTLLTGTNTKTTNSQIPPRRRASGDFGEHPQWRLLGSRSEIAMREKHELLHVSPDHASGMVVAYRQTIGG